MLAESAYGRRPRWPRSQLVDPPQLVGRNSFDEACKLME